MTAYNKITVKAYGKLNLLLDIVGRRKDGYHILNTVMQSVSCYDILDVQLLNGKGIEIKCSKEDFPCNENNLIWKACTAFKEYTGIDFGGKIVVTVEKHIPSMAGMAGGSADCAAMLHALNIMYNTFLDDDKLCEIGVKLGADVPFCLLGGTRICQNIGDKTNKLPSPDCCFIVIKPDISISTPEAYKKYDDIAHPPKCDVDSFLKSLAKGNIYSTCLNMKNVLEIAVDMEEIKKAKEALMKSGALTAMMTGSGSAVFGVFKDQFAAKEALPKLDGYSYKAICRTVNSGCEIISKQ